MKPVKEVQLDPAVSCSQNLSVVNVKKLMKDKKLRHILVVDSKNFPTGIISTVDICNRVVAEGRDPNTTTAKDIMTSPILVKNSEDDLGELYRIMMEQNLYSIPIVEAGKIKGVLTFNSALKQLTKGE